MRSAPAVWELEGPIMLGPMMSKMENSFLAWSFTTDTQNKDCHPNTADILLTNREGERSLVTGVSVGGGAAVIKRINGVDMPPRGR